MAKPRNFEIDGIYHIVSRGYDKRDIFLDESYYKRFAESLLLFNTSEKITVREARKREAGAEDNEIEPDPLTEVLAYTLMPNHFHLVLREIREGGISKFMQKLGTGYTRYFNERNNRTGLGGLFQSRYQSVRIKTDDQLLNVFVYVLTNPVELWEKDWKKKMRVRDGEKALARLARYPWSSYHSYFGDPAFPGVTSTGFFLEFFGSKRAAKRAVEDWVKFKADRSQLGEEIIE